jgi:enoyl-CoA hydratase
MQASELASTLLPDKVRIIEAGPAVGLVEINRPTVRNALDVETVAALGRALFEMDSDPAIRAIVIAGVEGHLSAGSDIKEMHRLGFSCLRDPRRVEGWRRIESVRTPLIAAVDGMAFGAGFELALLADFIVCAKSASFGLPEVKLGVMPGDGGSQRLARLIGQNAALRIILTGETVSGEAAMNMGIATPADDGSGSARETALRLAAQISEHAPLATRMVKKVVRSGLECSLATGLTLEADALEILFGTSDRAEGMTAFVEKRAPRFEGR